MTAPTNRRLCVHELRMRLLGAAEVLRQDYDAPQPNVTEIRRAEQWVLDAALAWARGANEERKDDEDLGATGHG